MQIFKPIVLVQNLPLNIECLSAHGDHVVVATKQGHLMTYRFVTKKKTSASTSDSDVALELIQSFKQFSKKPVTQVEVVPNLKIIITLSDGLIHVNNLDDLAVIQIIQKTKGASYFALNLQTQETLTGEVQYMLRMCVVVKKRLIQLYWKNRNFHEMSKEFNLNEQPKIVTWCSESIFLGHKSEYELLRVEDGETKSLSVTGTKNPEPIIKMLQGDKVSINKDENTYILDQYGEPLLKNCVSWSDIPTSMAEDNPYLVALLPSSIIEIRTVEPNLFIQRMELATLASNYGKVKLLAKCTGKDGLLVAASSSDIIGIVATSLEQQKLQMINERHFELALRLANMNSKTPDDSSTRDIELQYAHDLFHRASYKEALDLFDRLDISPLIVLELFPDLSDKEFLEQDVLVVRGNSEEERIIALIDYLVQMRRKINKMPARSSSADLVSLEQQSVHNTDDDYTLFSHMRSPRALELLKQEVDTALLKCYLKTNNALVASLLRLPENHCKQQITEKILIKYHKYNELMILYQNRGLHRKALELCKNQFSESPTKGYEKTVQYLQHLGQEHLEIICKYATSVLEDEPDLGLKIFTADLPECESLDRNLVLEYLRQTAPHLEIPYLEHLIHFWNDKTSFFHTELVLRYRQKVKPLLSQYLGSIGDDIPCPAGQEPGELGELRLKLLDFLEFSDYYTTQNLPNTLLEEGLNEERAIVVGKMGQHEEALSIFIYVLNNPKRAEEYCMNVHRKKLPNSGDIFFLLLKVYLHSPGSLCSSQLQRKISISSASRNVSNSVSPLPASVSSRIVRLLKDHGDKIDPRKAIAELPDEFDLASLREYLSTTLQAKVEQSHELEMFRQLTMSKYYQVQKTWIQLQKANKIVIDGATICQVCSKRIGTSAFVRFPNLDLVHYSCQDRYGRFPRAQQQTISDDV